MTTILLLLLTAMPTMTQDDLLDAIKTVESNGNAEAIGDQGRSIGAYQIMEGYFKDAQQFDKSLKKYKYADVKKDDVARKVIKAYLLRYCNKRRLGREPTFEDMARCHNGGPNGYKKKATIKYWKRVKKEMSK